jgi:hypothetical protein
VALLDLNRISVRIRYAGLRPDSVRRGGSREVDPPLEGQVASWSAGGTLDWWVKERREWFGRMRGKDGRQRWIKAADLRRRIGPMFGSCLFR